MKKKIAILMCLTILGTTTASTFAHSENIEINGKKIETKNIDNLTLIQIREAAEALGYEINWDAETKTVALIKGAHYITFSIGVNGYTFARTAPMPLSHEPVVIDGYTYVPYEILSEIMGLELINTEDGYVINTVEEDAVDNEIKEEQAVATGVVVEINDNSITFNDDVMGEVILNISEETKIIDINDNQISLEDLKVDDNLEVVYGEAMTMSLPPLNNPVSVRILK